MGIVTTGKSTHIPMADEMRVESVVPCMNEANFKSSKLNEPRQSHQREAQARRQTQGPCSRCQQTPEIGPPEIPSPMQ